MLPTLRALIPLVEAELVSLFLHRDDANDPPGASDYIDEALELSEFPTPIEWGDARAEPAFDALVWFGGAPTAHWMALKEQLGLPVAANRYEVEHLCIAAGVLEASLDSAFCPLPWTHLHLESDGIATPCCVAQADDTRGGPSLADHSLPEVFNSPLMRRVRLNMLRGARDPVCRHCWRAEEESARSQRFDALRSMTWLDDRDEVKIADLAADARSVTVEDGSVSVDKIAPLSIDIRWSNVCNLKCRMCWHRSSSSWFDDARRIAAELDVEAGVPTTAPRDQSARRFLLWNDKAIVSFNDDLRAVEKIEPYLHKLRHVYSAGGEPLMMEQHFELLERLQPRAPQIRLAYNTNFSFLQFRGRNLVELWEHFKKVELGLSIDGLGPVGEYVRTGFRTQRFLDNLVILREATRHHHDLKYTFHVTISAYNVFHVPEFVRESIAKGYVSGPDQFKFNVVYQPIYASPSILPTEMRERAAEAFDGLFLELDRDFPNQNPFNRAEMATVTMYLRSPHEGLFEAYRNEAWSWLERLDRLRSTSWRDVVPHLACFEH